METTTSFGKFFQEGNFFFLYGARICIYVDSESTYQFLLVFHQEKVFSWLKAQLINWLIVSSQTSVQLIKT